ncbi:WHG domain-containing protein [Aquibacillus koreensis]|uniref:WHG domain-containing protein n=1 Tax=Aquibacillus koreensis TaxID=279446 RepID=A0A9X3WFN9_9BACI|nr:TetR/AcrR family transcriptional regulator [Aquibacillus koreensis]MCT2537491.1 WHG domain-containing protein [Aquibacillus koreensis]MDC3418937.1 WHG domain-containing protein [Aquibacillus koreensis]
MSPRIGLSKQKVLEAAINIADDEGIEKVTMATIAKKLNIKPPSLYNHISSLSALKTEMALVGIQQLYSSMKANMEGISGDERVIALSKGYLNFARNHPGLYESTLAAPNAQDKEIYEAANKIVQLAVQTIKHYNFTKEEELHVVRGLRSLLHGFSSLEKANGFGIPIKLNHSFDYIMTTYLKGMKR